MKNMPAPTGWMLRGVLLEETQLFAMGYNQDRSSPDIS
jgi:hypothetical protein